MFPANLFRSAHYLNLQPQQPLQHLLSSPSSSSSSLTPNTLPSHSFILFSHYCAPRSPFLSVSLTISSSFEFPWADVSARVLTGSFTHSRANGGGGCGGEDSGAGGMVSGFWSGFGRKGGFQVSVFRLARLCDLWSLTSCLHIGGHGCGVEGDLKSEQWGRALTKNKKRKARKLRDEPQQSRTVPSSSLLTNSKLFFLGTVYCIFTLT